MEIAISEPVSSDVTDLELEEELAELLKEEDQSLGDLELPDISDLNLKGSDVVVGMRGLRLTVEFCFRTAGGGQVHLQSTWNVRDVDVWTNCGMI